MSKRTAITADIIVGAVWFTLAVLSGVYSWGWGWTLAFALFAGERYGTGLHR